MLAGGSPFACACAALLPDRVQALVLVCPLMPTAGREEQLLPGGVVMLGGLPTAVTAAGYCS